MTASRPPRETRVPAHHVRVGVVGAGWWATRVHLPELAQHESADVVAVCDESFDRAVTAAEAYGVRAVTDVSDVLAAGVDAVVVATPHDQHAAIARKFLAAGIDVLVEKPMTLEPRDAWALVRTARKSSARLHTGFTHMYGRPARRIRDVLRSGGLGRLTLVSGLFATAVHRLYRGEIAWQQTVAPAAVHSLPGTYSEADRGGGQLWAQTVHAIALLLWSTELVPRDVTAMQDSAGLSVDVSDALAVRFTSGAVGTIAGTGVVAQHDRRIEEFRFVGERGQATLDTVRATLTVVPQDGKPAELRWSSEAEINQIGAPARCLVDSVLHEWEADVGGELGAWVTGVAWAAARSYQTGLRTAVPAPDDETSEGIQECGS